MKTIFNVYWTIKKKEWLGKGGVAQSFTTLEEAVKSLKVCLKDCEEDGYEIINAYVMELEEGNTRNVVGIPFFQEIHQMPAYFCIDKMTAEDPYGMHTYKMAPDYEADKETH